MKEIIKGISLRNDLDEKSQYLLDLALTNKAGNLPSLDQTLARIRYHNKRIIAFEGINACGKTTQINLLKDSNERLLNNGLFFTPKYTNILPEKIVFSNLKGYFSSRLGAVEESLLFMAIETYRNYACANETQEFVVFDRYTHTIENFQVLRLIEEGYDPRDSINWLKRLSSFVPPDSLTFYLDINVNTSISRLKNRGRDNQLRQEFTTRDMNKANLIYKLYEKMAASKPTVVSINGNRKQDDVFSDVYLALSEFIL